MIREIIEYLLSLLKSRLVPMVLAFVVLFSILIGRLFSLQIVNGETYEQSLNNSIKKTTSVAAARGRIFDKNGVLLAYNELAFAVKISDSGTYKNVHIKNQTVNNAINKTLELIEEKGDAYVCDFDIKYAGDGNYEFSVSGNSLLRFKRDSYGAAKISELTEEQVNATANDMIDYMCSRYELDKSMYDPEHLLAIINLRLLMSANLYNRYITFTIANDVSDETVAAILENSEELVGVTVEEQYIRKYVDSIYCSQIIGYTGAVSSAELENLKIENDSYERNDIVGKSGIEKSMESVLSGTKGTKTVYVDTVGRITEVLDETESKAGNDIYLTIDIELQKRIYYAIEDNLVNIILSNLVENDQKYKYDSVSGDIDEVYITIKEVYFALLDNNVISLDRIAASENRTEAQVYSTFSSKKDVIMSWLEAELLSAGTPYNSLSEENRNYIWYIYNDMLKTNKVFVSANVDANDEIYKTWKDGGAVSIAEFLKYAISKNWIDVNRLSTEQYSSLQESYDALVEYILDKLKTDDEFDKLLYNYLIKNGNISGRQVCLLLYEQQVLAEDSDYASLRNGTLSASSFIKDAIAKKRITPAQLALKPCSGACVITNPNNGDVIALVSYPSYDNNKLSGSVDSQYYNKLLNDKSNPLYNWATQSLTAPGSTFKVCTSIAGLDTGIITPSTSFYCSGTYTKVTPSPKCWNRDGHRINETVTTAIRDSCNLFFYDVGYRLACSQNGRYNSTYATGVLQEYAEKLGLATPSGIEIEEKAPSASDTDAVASAIGQGNHLYSALNLARYVTTVANSGTCYNLTLVDKITDNSGELIKDNQAEVANQLEVSQTTWDLVHTGMKMAAATYPTMKSLNVTAAAKSGTAQENLKEPNHALSISYAPYDNPEIAIGVSLKNGYISSHAVEVAAAACGIYFEMYGENMEAGNE